MYDKLNDIYKTVVMIWGKYAGITDPKNKNLKWVYINHDKITNYIITSSSSITYIKLHLLTLIQIIHNFKDKNLFVKYKKLFNILDSINFSTNITGGGKKQFDLSKWSKNYRMENSEKFRKGSMKYYNENTYNVLRKKILRNLNNGSVKTPRPDTVKKYNLKYSKKNSCWI